MESIAYFAAGVGATDPARDVPQFARVLQAGPWMLSDVIMPDGARGAMIWWSDCERPDQHALEWRTCPDGLRYGKPKNLPDLSEIAKRTIQPGIDVTLVNGMQVTVPVAMLEPRKIDFGSGQAGEPATEFGRRAFAVQARLAATEKGKGLPITDPDVLHLIGMAMMQTYRLPPELLSDLGWVTTVDVDPILCAIMGSDPKDPPPAPTSSPLPASGSTPS